MKKLSQCQAPRVLIFNDISHFKLTIVPILVPLPQPNTLTSADVVEDVRHTIEHSYIRPFAHAHSHTTRRLLTAFPRLHPENTQMHSRLRGSCTSDKGPSG